MADGEVPKRMEQAEFCRRFFVDEVQFAMGGRQCIGTFDKIFVADFCRFFFRNRRRFHIEKT